MALTEEQKEPQGFPIVAESGPEFLSLTDPSVILPIKPVPLPDGSDTIPSEQSTTCELAITLMLDGIVLSKMLGREMTEKLRSQLGPRHVEVPHD